MAPPAGWIVALAALTMGSEHATVRAAPASTRGACRTAVCRACCGVMAHAGQLHGRQSALRGGSGAVSSAASPLPEGWEELMDDNYGIPYFYHASSGETVWERPAPAPSMPSPPAIPPPLPPEPRPPPAPHPVLSSEPNSLPEGWEELMDEDYGIPYFYHASSGETVWERPAPAPSMPSPPAILPEPRPPPAPPPVPSTSEPRKLMTQTHSQIPGGGGSLHPGSRAASAAQEGSTSWWGSKGLGARSPSLPLDVERVAAVAAQQAKTVAAQGAKTVGAAAAVASAGAAAANIAGT